MVAQRILELWPSQSSTNERTLPDGYESAALQRVMQWLLELDVNSRTGADRYERKGERQTYRNGYRSRRWRTAVGEIRLFVPKLRKGTYTPDFINDETEDKLREFVADVYVDGVEVKRLRDTVESIGLSTPAHYEEAEIVEQLEAVIWKYRRYALVLPIPEVNVNRGPLSILTLAA
ncbi:MAG: transposase [Burkholderiales bacterium]|nr:transposase [Anaerolineae bacterium]